MSAKERITKFETILNTFDGKIEAIEELLGFFETHHSEFLALMEYYYSKDRQEDLAKEDAGALPQDLPRGVLSEDAIYNLFTDYRRVSLQMLEVGTQFFKEN